MMAEKRKTYTAECQREAVRLVTEHGYGVGEAARNLGVNANMLRRWKRELVERENGAFPGKGRLSPEQEELHRLREEVKRLRMEWEILKKPWASLPTTRDEIGLYSQPLRPVAYCSSVPGVGSES
jgi:transposase